MPDVESKLDLHLMKNLQVVEPSFNSVKEGVSVGWLSQAFDLPEASVRYRLRNCPMKQESLRGKNMQIKVYDLKTAATFLVAPAYSTREYMKRLKRGDLPPQLQETVWNALLKRQKWEENAGNLWRTEAIREVLGSTFQTLKFTMQLWTDTLERQVALSDEQRDIIIQLVDALQGDLYNALVENMNNNETGPQITDLETMFGETESIASMSQRDDSFDIEEVEETEIENMV